MRRVAMTLAIILAACAAPIAMSTSNIAAAQTTASPVPAQLPPSDSADIDPSKAPAGNYAMDPRHASVVWRLRHMGLSIYTARFDGCTATQGNTCTTPGVSATMVFNPQHPEQSTVNATIQVAALDTGLGTDHAFDHEIGNVLSDNGAAPTITFVSTSVTRTGPTTGLVTGNLTLHGQTHPATMEVTFQGGRVPPFHNNKYDLAFTGRTIIQRNQWGAGNLIMNQFAGNDVEVIIQGEFVQQ
ncbi:MAG: YceI family protein [Alphaproteobacteria bacterium]